METPTVDGQAKLHNFFRRRAMMHVEGCWHVNRSPSVSDQAALDIKIKDKKMYLVLRMGNKTFENKLFCIPSNDLRAAFCCDLFSSFVKTKK